MTAPLLVFGWGNASRGDDVLGPLCVDRLRHGPQGDAEVEYLDDYQLQIEHALDLAGRRQVLFIDASLICAPPFEVTTLHPARDASYTSHALTPQALLSVFQDLHAVPPPASTLLAIRGLRFQLGEAPSAAALAHLDAALAWARDWLHTVSATLCPQPED